MSRERWLELKCYPERELRLFHRRLMDGAPTGYEPKYIPLNENSKRPVAGVGAEHPGGSIEDAVKMLSSGLNVGIAAREHDSLSIVDIDSPSEVDYLRPTLVVRTRSRTGDHAYYFGDGKNTVTEHGEVRTDNYYAVAPGSRVSSDRTCPLAGYYTVESDRRAAWITRSDYPTFLRESMNQSVSVSGGGDLSTRWEVFATVELLDEVMSRANEWNDGRYRTLRAYILPRLSALDHPNPQRWCSRWCQRSGGDWQHYLDCGITVDLPSPMKTETLNHKGYGPDDLTNHWKHLS